MFWVWRNSAPRFRFKTIIDVTLTRLTQVMWTVADRGGALPVYNVKAADKPDTIKACFCYDRVLNSINYIISCIYNNCVYKK